MENDSVAPKLTVKLAWFGHNENDFGVRADMSAFSYACPPPHPPPPPPLLL